MRSAALAVLIGAASFFIVGKLQRGELATARVQRLPQPATSPMAIGRDPQPAPASVVASPRLDTQVARVAENAIGHATGEEATELSRDLAELRSRPEESLRAIGAMLATRTDENFDEQRHFLIQFAARLATAPRERFELLARELARAVPSAAPLPQTSYSPALALDAMLDLADLATVETVLLPVLKSNRGTALADLLLARLGTKYPAREKSLRAQLASQRS